MALSTSPTFGFTLPQRGVFFGVTSVTEMLKLAAKVDANPLFGSIWVGDSLGAKPRPDSLTLLEARAAVTRRVRPGGGCMASSPRRAGRGRMDDDTARRWSCEGQLVRHRQCPHAGRA